MDEHESIALFLYSWQYDYSASVGNNAYAMYDFLPVINDTIIVGDTVKLSVGYDALHDDLKYVVDKGLLHSILMLDQQIIGIESTYKWEYEGSFQDEKGHRERLFLNQNFDSLINLYPNNKLLKRFKTASEKSLL